MREVKTTEDGMHKFYKLSKKEVSEARVLEKPFLVYEDILRCEDKLGKFLPREFLEEFVAKQNKKRKLKVSKKELDKIFDTLLSAGVIFYPRGGFVQRYFTFDWKDVKANVRAAKKEQEG